MASKRRGKITKKRLSRRIGYNKISSTKLASLKIRREPSSKLNLVVKNLILFFILFVISLVLYSVSVQEVYLNLFGLLSILFGFVSFAFVVVLFILIILKIARN